MQATTRPLPAAVQRQQQGPPHGAKAAEVYGIVGYLLSSVAFILWLLWAYTPDWVLQALSITYYPERYWAVALPGYFFLLVLYLIILYNGWNIANTNPFESYYTIRDTIEPPPVEKKGSEDWQTPLSIPPAEDIPISLVSKVLFCAPNART